MASVTIGAAMRDMVIGTNPILPTTTGAEPGFWLENVRVIVEFRDGWRR